MKTTKENALTPNLDVLAMENENQVQDSTTTRSAKKGGSKESANNLVTVETIEGFIYKELQKVELQNKVKSVSLSDLAKAANDGFSISQMVEKIEKENETISENNKKSLFAAAAKALKSYTFASVEEKRLFVQNLNKAKRITKGFSITYQNERDDRTKNIYKDGAFFSRPTVFTAAGLRTCYNSIEYTKKTIEDVRAKQAKANAVKTAKEYLIANGMPAVMLTALQDGQILSMYEKLTKESK